MSDERVRDVTAGAPAPRTRGEDLPPHEVTYERDGVDHTIAARWLIDATGRAGLIKRKLDLAQANDHDANAIWFRIGTRIDMDEWSTDSKWLNRCDPPFRWLSTNHLCGEGYWAWLIPLSSGSHSVGIVADQAIHPLKTMNSFERAMEWFAKYQPRLARELEDKRHLLQDFIALRKFSYGCKQVFSGSRWALTGEAGVFLDPFYSPGSDFIAISNTYITELIAKDRAGEPLAPYARLYEQFYFSFYRSTLSLYTNQYALFGDPEVMPVKVIWDYTYYWGVLCQLFFQHRLTDLTVMARMKDELSLCMALNEAMQKLMREWGKVSAKRNRAVMLDQANLDWFAELNRGLRDELDDAGFKARLRETTGPAEGAGSRDRADRARGSPPAGCERSPRAAWRRPVASGRLAAVPGESATQLGRGVITGPARRPDNARSVADHGSFASAPAAGDHPRRRAAAGPGAALLRAARGDRRDGRRHRARPHRVRRHRAGAARARLRAFLARRAGRAFAAGARALHVHRRRGAAPAHRRAFAARRGDLGGHAVGAAADGARSRHRVSDVSGDGACGRVVLAVRAVHGVGDVDHCVPGDGAHPQGSQHHADHHRPARDDLSGRCRRARVGAARARRRAREHDA